MVCQVVKKATWLTVKNTVLNIQMNSLEDIQIDIETNMLIDSHKDMQMVNIKNIMMDYIVYNQKIQYTKN